MNKHKVLRKPEFGQKTADFLNIVYKDYLAARVLLNNDLLIQGAVLASTAIEKYFKAILAFSGKENSSHLKKAHFNMVKNFDPKLWGDLNEDFIRLLQRAYHLRYLDKLEKNFNPVIASREFLAELDFTVLIIQNSFHLNKNGEEVVLMYHQDKNSNDSRLFYNNYLLTEIEKQSFISAKDQLVYEIRKCPLGGFFEVEYLTMPQPSDGKFMRTGFELQEDKEKIIKYQTAFKEITPLHCSRDGAVLRRV